MDDATAISNSMNRLVASEIRAWLGRRQITGRQLAAKLGASQTWTATRLRGEQAITVDDLARIADALDVEVTDLLPRPAYRDGRRTGEGGIMWPSSHAPATPATAGHLAHGVSTVRPRIPAQPAGGHHGESPPSGHRVDTRRTARQ